MDIELRNTGELIASCWDAAERETVAAVGGKYPGSSEEEITFLLSGELRAAIAQASESRRFEQAFLLDLRAAIPSLPANLQRQIDGLVARVNFHTRHHEGRRSASDLGVVITRPLASLERGRNKIAIRRDRASGLLAQAKLARVTAGADRPATWGRLTKPQRRIILDRIPYYSLLLYRLLDARGTELAPLRWQLCQGRTLNDVAGWLRSGDFPEEISSTDVIRRLVTGLIGTDDATIIESIVDPSFGRQIIEVHVYWPDGTGPPHGSQVVRRYHGETRLIQRVRV